MGLNSRSVATATLLNSSVTLLLVVTFELEVARVVARPRLEAVVTCCQRKARVDDLPQEEDCADDWDQVERKREDVANDVVLRSQSLGSICTLTVLNLDRGLVSMPPRTLDFPPEPEVT
jgi:hypothetical protein